VSSFGLGNFFITPASCSFDINIFRDEPELFYSVAGSFLKQFADAKPSPAHAFLARLAAAGVLQRVYTQNIDGLEVKSGVPAEKVVQCHGSLDSAMCASCNARTTIEVVHAAAAAGKVARCVRCRAGAIKPSVVFFHEALPKRFYTCLKADVKQADMVLVMGSSMRVAPVSKMLSLFPSSAAAVLVNRDRVTGRADQSDYCPDEFDVELLGDADLMCVAVSSACLLAPISPRLQYGIALATAGHRKQQNNSCTATIGLYRTCCAYCGPTNCCRCGAKPTAWNKTCPRRFSQRRASSPAHRPESC